MCRCQVCNRAAVALVATGPRRGALQGHVESGLSVVVEWPYHSERAGTPRRATNPLTGGHRPKKRLLRQVSPPGARGTVADQPRRYWCTYQQHCVSAGSGVTGARTSGVAGMPDPAAVLPGRLCSNLYNQTRKLIARGESDAIISL